MDQNLNEHNVQAIVYRLLNDVPRETDIRIFEAILKDDMGLDDEIIKSLLGCPIHYPENFNQMLSSIIQGIITNHPLLCELSNVIITDNLLDNISINKPMVRRMLHHIYLLDMLTVKLCLNSDNIDIATAYYHKLRQKMGIYGSWFRKLKALAKLTGRWFESLKVLLIDEGFKIDKSFREQAKEKLEFGDPIFTSIQRVITANIIEAVIKERFSGKHLNANAGVVLAVIQPDGESFKCNDHKQIILYGFPEHWDALYQSWNMLFCINNIDNLDIVFLKLIIPALLNCTCAEYLYTRAVSLWLTIQFQVFRLYSGKPRIATSTEFNEIAAKWSEINYLFSQKLLMKERGEKLKPFFTFFKFIFVRSWQRLKNKIIK